MPTRGRLERGGRKKAGWRRLCLALDLQQSSVVLGSVRGKAIEQSGATRCHQIGLTAAAAGVGRIPRRVAAAGAVKVADLGRTFSGAAGEVFAGMVCSIGKGPAVRL